MGRYGGPPPGTSSCGRVGKGDSMYKYVSSGQLGMGTRQYYTICGRLFRFSWEAITLRCAGSTKNLTPV